MCSLITQEITLTQADTLQLTCVALGGRPAPVLSWQSDLAPSLLHSQTSVLISAGDTVASLQLEGVVKDEGKGASHHWPCQVSREDGKDRDMTVSW